MLEVVGICRGRPYAARLTERGMWVVTCDGCVFVFPVLHGDPLDSVSTEIERLFQAFPEQGSSLT
jgi:hypothetical protein